MVGKGWISVSKLWRLLPVPRMKSSSLTILLRMRLASLAAKLGAIVLSLPDGPRGPARARNHGAASAQGDVLVFLDADVVVHPDTLGRIKTYLTEHPEIAALFGSYDADPRLRVW